MNAQRFSVDTNILMYSIDADAGTAYSGEGDRLFRGT